RVYGGRTSLVIRKKQGKTTLEFDPGGQLKSDPHRKMHAERLRAVQYFEIASEEDSVKPSLKDLKKHGDRFSSNRWTYAEKKRAEMNKTYQRKCFLETKHIY